MVFAISRQINKQKVCENSLLCAGNKVFVKCQAQGGGFTPNSPLAYALARVCQSNPGYKSAPTKAVVSVSSIEKPYLASAPSSLKPAVVDGLLDNFPVHILVDSGASENFVDVKICQKLLLAISGSPTSNRHGIF